MNATERSYRTAYNAISDSSNDVSAFRMVIKKSTFMLKCIERLINKLYFKPAVKLIVNAIYKLCHTFSETLKKNLLAAGC
jgi:hypothetical protein